MRLALDRKDQVAEFINRRLNLKEKLTENDIEKYNSSFINKIFQNREADVIYKKKDQQIFFLIEHQSKIDYLMPKRILDYQIAITDSVMNNRTSKYEEYPVVIPFVIYTGKRKWNAKKSFKECQVILKETYNMELGEYYLTDVNEYNKEEVLQDTLFINKIVLLERANNNIEFCEIVNDILKEENEERNLEFLYNMINQVYSRKLGEQKTKEMLEKFKRGGRKSMLIERLQREFDVKCERAERNGRRIGIKEGKKAGKEEGMRTEKIRMIKNMLKQNMKENKIIEIAEVSRKELEEIISSTQERVG